MSAGTAIRETSLREISQKPERGKRGQQEHLSVAWREALGVEDKDGDDSIFRLAGNTLDLLVWDNPAPGLIAMVAGTIGRELGAFALPHSGRIASILEALARVTFTAQPDRLGQVMAGLAAGLAEPLQTVAPASSLEAGGESQPTSSSRVATRSRLHDETSWLRMFQSTHVAILSANSLVDILDLAVRFVSEILATLSTTIVTYDFAVGEFTIQHSNRPEFSILSRRPIRRWDMIDRLRQGQEFYIPDVRSYPGDLTGLETVVQIGGRSFLAMPLIYRGELIGAYTLSTAEVHGFETEEVALVRQIATIVAVAIQHRQALESEYKARMNEATLREMAASLTLGLDLNELLDGVLRQLNRVVECVSMSIVLIENGQPRLAAQRPQSHKTTEQFDDLMAREGTSVRRVLETGEPVVVADTTAHADWIWIPGFEYIRSWMGIPLLVKGVCIGALTLDRDQPRSFRSADLDLALAFANQAAIAIENTRLFREEQAYAERLETRVRERTQELEALYGITAATLENPNLSGVLNRALELAVAAFGCSTGIIFLITDNEAEPTVAAWLDLHGRDISGLAEDSGLVSRLYERLPAVSEPWIVVGDALPVGSAAMNIQTMAVAPLRARTRTYGFLCLFSRTGARFAGAEKLLVTIADQIGAAVENIELHQKTRLTAIIEERERLARDLHDAVTQTLYSLTLFAEAARESALAGDMARVLRYLQSVEHTSRQAFGEMRVLLYELRTETLARKGLTGAIEERLQAVEARAGIQAELRIDEDLPPLPVTIEEAFYRVAVEALNNAMRHSQARQVEVTLTVEDGALTMIIRDNGVGFRLKDVAGQGGLGLSNMEERMKKTGGGFKIVSRLGRGTRIEARVPLDDRAAAG